MASDKITAAMSKVEFVAECKRRREEGLKVFGAYKFKDQIKAAGGIWDGQLKAWLIPNRDVAVSLDLVRKEGRHGSYYVTRGSAERSAAKRQRELETNGCSYCGMGAELGLTSMGERLLAELGECPKCGIDFDGV